MENTPRIRHRKQNWRTLAQRPLRDRLLGSVRQLSSGCQVWVGRRDRYGYGVIVHRGKLWKIHRLAWALHYGEIPPGLCVLHACDNPACTNPEHLLLGTQTANLVDRDRKARGKVPVRSAGTWTGRMRKSKPQGVKGFEPLTPSKQGEEK